MITRCARQGVPFGAVAWDTRGGPGREDPQALLEAVGTLAHVQSAENAQAGGLLAHCQGAQRFRIRSVQQRPDGLWAARVCTLAGDAARAPPQTLVATVRALATTIRQLQARHAPSVAPPYEFDDAGWVANRWCELLPIPQATKQKLMELVDPVVRLQLVDNFLRQSGVLGAPER
jgi:Lon protease-like protein